MTTNTDNRLTGIYHKLNRDVPISHPGEAKQLVHQIQETTFQSTDNTQTPESCDWADN